MSKMRSPRADSYLLTSPGYVLLETNYTGSNRLWRKIRGPISERDVLRGPG